MDTIYEVNLFVRREIEEDYRAWLEMHIAEILALPGFVDAQSFDVHQDEAGDEVAICVQYRLQSMAALENYFEQHAPRLRADGVARFGDRFRARRRVLLNARVFSS